VNYSIKRYFGTIQKKDSKCVFKKFFQESQSRVFDLTLLLEKLQLIGRIVIFPTNVKMKAWGKRSFQHKRGYNTKLFLNIKNKTTFFEISFERNKIF
jgi:hypothetical protein